MSKIPISSLCIVKQEISSSIFLYFNYTDYISILVLAAAAYEISDTLCKESGGWSIRGFLENKIPGGKDRKYIFNILNAPYNSLKHVKQTVPHIESDHAEVLLFIAVTQYWYLTQKKLPWDMSLYLLWYSRNKSKLISSTFNDAPWVSSLLKVDITGYTKPELYRDFLKLTSELHL